MNQEIGLPNESPKIHRLTSDYLLPPFDTEREYSYKLTLADIAGKPGSYEFALDPNSCVLDEFGRAIGCTLMAPLVFEVRLDRVATDGHVSLYDLCSDEPLPARLRLVLSRDSQQSECPARLLALDADGYISQIVHLYP